MQSLREINSEINVLEARNNQLEELIEKYDADCSKQIASNKDRLRELYDKRAEISRTLAEFHIDSKL